MSIMSFYVFNLDCNMEFDEKPDEKDCCGTGCNPCILDVYENTNKLKGLKLDAKNRSNVTFKNVISPTSYAKFKVLYVERVYDFLLLTFSYILENVNSKEEQHDLQYNSGQYFIIKASSSNNDSTYFSRPYTPIKSIKPIFLQTPNTHDNKSFGIYFQIIIKVYENGLMSNYLKNLKIGDETIWRGPYGDFKYEPNTFKYILMICQGTAIAPMFSIIDEILNNEEDDSRVMLYYCCKDLNNIILRNELYKFRLYWNFSYEIYLSSVLYDNESLKKYLKYKECINNKRLSDVDVKNYLLNKDKACVLIAGSERFMFDFDNIVQQCNVENIFLFA